MIQLSHELPNGLRLIGEQNPDALSMAAGYFVRTGARDEELPVSGVSHFLEHMAFKGSRRRSAEDVNREFDEIGADYNAFTGDEYTVYYAAVLPEQQAKVVDLLTDMMRPSIRVTDFEMEKQVILEEIALYKDQPSSRLHDRARAVYYNGHPLGQSILGAEESIQALQAEQMRAYMQRRYTPRNMVLTLAGNLDWRAAVAQAEKLTREWNDLPAERRYPEFTAEPREELVRDDGVTQAHLCLAAPGVWADSEERYAAALLADIIGGGEGSRLHWELVHPGLASSARLTHDEEDRSGAFWGYINCEPDKAGQAVARFRNVLARIMDEGPSEAELERARRRAASSLVLHDETPRGRLFSLGFQWFYTGRIDPPDVTIDRYLSVTLEEVQALLAKRQFENLTVVGLGPFDSLS